MPQPQVDVVKPMTSKQANARPVISKEMMQQVTTEIFKEAKEEAAQVPVMCDGDNCGCYRLFLNTVDQVVSIHCAECGKIILGVNVG